MYMFIYIFMYMFIYIFMYMFMYMCTYPPLQGVAGNPVLPMSEFVNNKLTAKTNRQMQGMY